MLNIYLRMTYVSIWKFGPGNSVLSPLNNTYIFPLFYFCQHGFGTQDRALTPSFCFPLISLFFIRLGQRGCGIEPPQPNFMIF